MQAVRKPLGFAAHAPLVSYANSYLRPRVRSRCFARDLRLRAFQPMWVLYLVAGFLIVEPIRYLVSRGERTFQMRTFYFAIASFVNAFVSTLVGTAGPIMNPFYLKAEVVKDEMIGTKAASTLLMQILKVAISVSLGLLTTQILFYSALLGIGALIGNFLGKPILNHLRVS